MSRHILIFVVFLINLTPFIDATESAFPLYLNGYMGPKAGYMPPPGLYLRDDYYHHPGHVKEAVLGGRVSGKANVKISLDLLNLTYVSHIKLLGADVACGVLIPFGKIDVHAQVSAPVPSFSVARNTLGIPVPTLSFNTVTKKKHQVAHGIADTLIIPIMLGWHAESYNLHVIAFQGLFVPTGSFSKKKIANMGQNHYATETDVGFTWLNTKIGSEVSVMTGITSNFTNHKIHYRSGTGWHTDFFAGQYLTKKMQIGLSGYWFYQLTPDSGRGAKILGGFRSYIFGLGPSFSYEFELYGIPLLANIRYLKEMHSRNYLKGDSFYFTISLPLS